MEKSKPMPITPQEEKEIHLAFERLCDFPLKVKLNQEKLDIDAWIEADRAKSHQYGYVEPVAFIRKSLARKDEIDKELEALKLKQDVKVCANDVTEMFRFLNYKATRKEVEEMIWEVDENLDGFIDWPEFRLMFNRNVLDQTGLEPNRMYNLAQFLIYDKNRNGLVSVDETMNLLYARYGRNVMEQKLKELFGEDMHEIGIQGGEINYSQFVKSVERVQVNMFLETNSGRKARRAFKEMEKKKLASTTSTSTSHK